MIKAYILIIIGFVFLIKGADYLVDGASNVAKKYNIPEIIIGLTIVSIGTSMPELFVSSTSAINGSSDMAIGNIIGSNVCNLLLILGLSSMIKSVVFKKETILIEIPMCLFITLLFTIFCNTGLVISLFEGVVLLLLFVLFIAYTVFMAKKGNDFDEEKALISKKKAKNISLLKNIILILVGVVLLKIGGDFVVDNAVVVAKYFNLGENVIALTILAVGTSLPELVTSVTAAIKGDSDIAIGNIIGSNIFNILLIIGVSSVITPLVFNTSYNLQLLMLIISMFVLMLFPFIPPKKEMSRSNGVVYFFMYIMYMILLFCIK